MKIKPIYVFIIFIILLSITGCNTNKTINSIDFTPIDSTLSDSANTINSIQQLENLYCMNYAGSYKEKNDFLNNWILNNIDTNYIPAHNQVSRDCSIFSVNNDSSNIFLARNFDWSDGCGIVMAKYSPPEKYSSIAFSRLEDMRITRYLAPQDFSDDEKMRFLYFPFYSVDGMNEKGLAIGIAGVDSQELKPDSNKQPIFITYFVRKVLDNCKNVDEVIELSQRYNLFDGSLKTISHHVLVTDAERNSLIIEYKNGEMCYSKTKDINQVITNQYLTDKSTEEKKQCWRYNAIYNQINSKNNFTSYSVMQILKTVYHGTAWSVVYDASNLNGLFSINGNYNVLYHFNL